MVTAKLTAIWRVITSKSAHVISQKRPGTEVQTIAFGQGDLRDMVLFAKQIKIIHDSFIQMMNEAAAQAGELHALQELREAVDVIQKEQENGRDESRSS